MLKTQYLLSVLFLYHVSKGNGRNFGEMEKPDDSSTERNITKISEPLKNSVSYQNDFQDEDEIRKIDNRNIYNSVLVTWDKLTRIGKPAQNGTQVDVVGKNGVQMGKLWKNSTHFGVFAEIVTENNVPEKHIILKNESQTCLNNENITHISEPVFEEVVTENITHISEPVFEEIVTENNVPEKHIILKNEIQTSLNNENITHISSPVFEEIVTENNVPEKHIILKNETQTYLNNENITHISEPVFEEIVTENNVPEKHIILKNKIQTSLNNENITHISEPVFEEVVTENITHISEPVFEEIVTENNVPEKHIILKNEMQTSLNNENITHISSPVFEEVVTENITHISEPVFEEIVTENNVPEKHIILKNETQTYLNNENITHISEPFEDGTQISVIEKNSSIIDTLKGNGIEDSLKGGNGTHTSITTKNGNHVGVSFENGTQKIGIIWNNHTHIVVIKAKNGTYIKNQISDQDERKKNSEIDENNIQKHEYQHCTNNDVPQNCTEIKENSKIKSANQKENDTNTKHTISDKFPPGLNITMKARKFKKKYLKLFEEYKKKFSKTYSSVRENKKRFRIFTNNMKKIERRNNKKISTTVFNIGFLDDLTVKEKQQYLNKIFLHHSNKPKLHKENEDKHRVRYLKKKKRQVKRRKIIK